MSLWIRIPVSFWLMIPQNLCCDRYYSRNVHPLKKMANILRLKGPGHCTRIFWECHYATQSTYSPCFLTLSHTSALLLAYACQSCLDKSCLYEWWWWWQRWFYIYCGAHTIFSLIWNALLICTHLSVSNSASLQCRASYQIMLQMSFPCSRYLYFCILIA